MGDLLPQRRVAQEQIDLDSITSVHAYDWKTGIESKVHGGSRNGGTVKEGHLVYLLELGP